MKKPKTNQKLKKYFLRYCRPVATCLGAVPYSWDSTTSEMKFRQSRWLFYWATVQFYTYVGYELFLIGRAIHAVKTGEPSEEVLKLTFTVSSHLVPLAMGYGNIRYYGKYGCFITRFFRHVQKLEETSKSPLPDCRKGIFNLLWVGTGVTLLNIAVQLRKPHTPRLISSLLSIDAPKWLRGCAAVLQIWSWVYQWSLVFFYVSFLLIFLNAAVWNQKLLKFGLTSGLRLTPSQFCSHWRQINVLLGEFNYLWKYPILYFEISLALTTSLGIVSVIRDGKPRPLLVAFLTCQTILSFWNKMAKVFEESTEARASWRSFGSSSDAGKHLQRFIISAKPNRILIGSFFFADRQLVLTLISLIFSQAINMLVMTR